LPLEVDILEIALALLRGGQAEFHGFGIARELQEQRGSRALTGHGTLYKALGRLQDFGLLTSRWEDTTAVEGRPRRRLYELTQEGTQVIEQVRADRGARRAVPTRGRAKPAPA
jgi:DNA-binding PadR family transcriptional regulator